MTSFEQLEEIVTGERQEVLDRMKDATFRYFLARLRVAGELLGMSHEAGTLASFVEKEWRSLNEGKDRSANSSGPVEP